MSVQSSQRFWILAGCALWLAFWTSCAKIGAPPGGPEDKTGPSLVEFYPLNNAILMPRRMTARLVFSEPVNRATVEAALFLSPDPRQRLRYKWHGKTLELIFLDSLDAERTYVISVGSQAKDLRGNPAGETRTIAFSTGEHIDRGQIEGWITGETTPQAVSLCAYRMESDSIPDPSLDEADYRLQAGSDGFFRFEYIKAGRYRIFAMTDRNSDGFWNPPGERLGLPPWDVTVSDSTMPWISFRLAEFDTLPAQTKLARAIHPGQIDLRFTRSVSSVAAYLLSSSWDTVRLKDAFADTAGLDLWHLFPSDTLAVGKWILESEGIDPLGLPWTDSDTVDVRSRPDTARPHLLYTTPPQRTTVLSVPETLSLVFDEPVVYSPDSGMINEWMFDTVSFHIELQQSVPRELFWIPEPPITAGKSYSLHLDGRTIRDAAGNTASDSSIILSFGILSPDSMGTLVGKIETRLSDVFLLSVLALKDRRLVRQSIVKGSESFSISHIPAGKYLLEVVLDRDRNHRYSPGQLEPWLMSEPFVLPRDTVTIRARWEFDARIEWPVNP